MAHAEAFTKNGFVLRPARLEDAEEYYQNNFNPLDAETARLTGSQTAFSRDEVTRFFKQCVQAPDRHDFLILSPDGHIIGESVLNEMNADLRSANFRIALFHSDACGKGVGSWAAEKTLEYAFEERGLHRVSLEVLAFNDRAIRAYEKAGFQREGVLRDAVKDGGSYADIVLMAILEDEWRRRKHST